MNNLTNQSPELFDGGNNSNFLQQYVQSLDSNALLRLSKPSAEAAQLMEQNLIQMLGNLPNSNFEVTISTDKQSLGQLLASAMINGYFLRRAEERMGLEKQLAAVIEK